jgi:transposase-like protein
MMRERNLSVNHTTIYLWVQRYSSEHERERVSRLGAKGAANLWLLRN